MPPSVNNNLSISMADGEQYNPEGGEDEVEAHVHSVGRYLFSDAVQYAWSPLTAQGDTLSPEALRDAVALRYLAVIGRTVPVLVDMRELAAHLRVMPHAMVRICVSDTLVLWCGARMRALLRLFLHHADDDDDDQPMTV